MEEYSWYDAFIEYLYDRFSKRAQLAEELMTLLCIEREAVYRRLRKEVVFPIHEIVKIASAWHISLDEVMGINSGLVPFQMQPLNYINPTKTEMFNLTKKVQSLEHIGESANSEYLEVSNKLPRPIYINSMTLYRFEIFKWLCQYNPDKAYVPYSQVVIPEKICQQFENYSKYIRQVNNSSYILDPMIFEHFVQNIKYFFSIMLISTEEKELLKGKLHDIIDYLMKIAIAGCYPETQQKVNIYISQLSINTNYSYYYTEQLKACRIHAFGKYDVISYDVEMVENFRKWMNLKKRSAIQISETNERQRIEYFTKQHTLIDSL